MYCIIFIICGLIFPAGWIVAESKGSAAWRRSFGALTVVIGCVIGFSVGGSLKEMRNNYNYQAVSKQLLEAVAAELPPGSREEQMITDATATFRPNYERPTNYDDLCHSIIQQLNEQPNKPDGGNGE